MDLEFYHLRYPSPNSWEKIDDGYTIDGNDVKIVATIANFSGESKRATVNFKELNENMELPGGKIDADFPPHRSFDRDRQKNRAGRSAAQTGRHRSRIVVEKRKALPARGFFQSEGLGDGGRAGIRQEKSRRKRARH
jgi:hypothetical protein